MKRIGEGRPGAVRGVNPTRSLRAAAALGTCAALFLAGVPAVSAGEGAAGHFGGAQDGDPARAHGDGAGSAEALLPQIAGKSRLRVRIPRVELPILDAGPLRAQDEAAKGRAGARGRRIGVRRGVENFVVPAHPENRRNTLRLADGSRLWTGEIAAPGAHAVRVRFSRCSVPEGATVTVYDADEPSESYAVETPPAGAGSVPVLAPTVFGERVRIELHLPAGALPPTDLAVADIVHHYREPLPAEPHPDHFGDGELRVGNCHPKVACDATQFPTTAHGVAHITFDEQGSTYLCSGALLADTDGTTDAPWFLTAFHCVSTTENAATLEAYWDYYESCSGGAPSLGSVPRTVGSSIAASSPGNDATLLYLTGTIPANRYFLPWTTTRPPVGAAVKCVHHPDGAPMKVATGAIVDYAGMVDVVWSLGVTEGGSSGSPLLDASGNVIGQLWGGASYCSVPQGVDSYGRLELSYTAFQPFLAGDAPPPPPVVAPPYTAPPVPPVPTNLAATPGESGGAVLRWRESGSGATSIEVARRDGAGTQARLGSVSPGTLTFTDAEPRAGWPTTYRVRALNSFGPSAYGVPTEHREPASGTIAISKAKLTDSESPRRDSAKLKITYTHTAAAFDGAAAWDPLVNGLAVQVGDAAAPVVLEIPAQSGGTGAGWRGKKGKYTWKSPKGVLPKVVVISDQKRGTVTVTATSFDFARTPTKWSIVHFATGRIGSTYSGLWTPRGVTGIVEIK